MKLWEKNYSIDGAIEAFTVGRDREMDLYLAKYDVLGSMAHITMLNTIGLISDDELPVLLNELREIYKVHRRRIYLHDDRNHRPKHSATTIRHSQNASKGSRYTGMVRP